MPVQTNLQIFVASLLAQLEAQYLEYVGLGWIQINGLQVESQMYTEEICILVLGVRTQFGNYCSQDPIT